MPRKSTEQYVKEVTAKHTASSYDYSETIYRGVNSPITVICSTHGKFRVNAGNHLSGNGGKGIGCKKCAIIKMGAAGRKSFQSFLTEAKIVHGKKYIYRPDAFQGYSKKTTIVCRQHGAFLQTPAGHVNGNNGQGHGCPKCSIEEQRLTTE